MTPEQKQLKKAQKEVIAEVGIDKVYWAKYGSDIKYHVDLDCPAFSLKQEIYEGTVSNAFAKGIKTPCRRCIHEIDETEWKELNAKNDFCHFF